MAPFIFAAHQRRLNGLNLRVDLLQTAANCVRPCVMCFRQLQYGDNRMCEAERTYKKNTHVTAPSTLFRFLFNAPIFVLKLALHVFSPWKRASITHKDRKREQERRRERNGGGGKRKKRKTRQETPLPRRASFFPPHCFPLPPFATGAPCVLQPASVNTYATAVLLLPPTLKPIRKPHSTPPSLVSPA